MITGIQDVYYYVSDMPRGVRFYRDVLQLTLAHQDKSWTSFDVGGMRVGLHWTGGKPVPEIPKGRNGALAGGTLTFRVSNLIATVEDLRKAGVKFLGDVITEDWGSIVAFEDPDGNVLKLMQRSTR
ncbi:MAG TPA: VOC family protein [bacterium]|nr:VOC family protein [bacterium]